MERIFFPNNLVGNVVKYTRRSTKIEKRQSYHSAKLLSQQNNTLQRAFKCIFEGKKRFSHEQLGKITHYLLHSK